MNVQRRWMLGTAGLAAATGGALLWQLQELPLTPAVEYVLLDGQRADSTQWRGKVMLVNFWATSCTTCVKKMPMLVATHERFRAEGYDTLAVAMQYDPPAYVARFAESRKLPFGVAIDNQGHLARAFGDVRVTPTTLLIDRRGHIVKRVVGEIGEQDLHGQIVKLLADRAG